MNRIVQALLYAAFAAVVGYFSLSPGYRYGDADLATIKVSLSHATNRVEECVKLTPRQISERATRGEPLAQCPRERLPLTVELDIDGVRVLNVTAAPSGLWNDGPSSVYERLSVDPGMRTVTVRLRDSARNDGWDYEHSEQVALVAGRYFTITFRAESGGFAFR